MLRTIIAISQIKGIGDAFFRKHLDILKKEKDEAIAILKQMDDRIQDEYINENMRHAEDIILQCSKSDISIIPIWDKTYPAKLLELSDAPVVLYAKGNLSLLQRKCVAVIGTRKSSSLGDRIANKIGSHFSQNYAICNGLVVGIDRASILIDEENVHPNVIGVLSGGLNYANTISKTSRQLADLVIKNNGLLISSFEPNVCEDSFSGSKASRIQAGLADALVLVESSIDGGSKYTLKSFVKLNRVIGVVSYKANETYQSSESFSANRLIANSPKEGIMQMCSLKTTKSLIIKDIVVIENSAGYSILENAISYTEKSTLFY